MRLPRAAWAASLLLAFPLLATGTQSLITWRLGETSPNDRPIAIGSLLKPFVAKAWARAHPGQDAPEVRCDAASGCWRTAGHGTISLSRAIAVSCNTYFRALAADTPAETLVTTFEAEGFIVPHPFTPDEAIGLEREGTVVIRPSLLLRAYLGLTRTPWPSGEPVRRVLLAGLRESPVDGTAVGLGPGYWGKTGTIPAIDGRPLATSGLAIAVDDAGSAVLGLLPEGTGRAAARSLGAALRERGMQRSESDAGIPKANVVRVRLFATLRPKVLLARNLGASPVGSREGFVGAGAQTSLRPGDRMESGLWELTLPGGLVRRVQGALACGGDAQGHLDVVAEVAPRDYVAGVLLAELPGVRAEDRRVDLGAAVLRFLSDGPRHGTVDVCDSTHCAWFLGRGPRVRWSSPTRFDLLELPSGAADAGLDVAVWARIEQAARVPGPHVWTAQCGGAPLSAHYVWGNGDRSVAVCPRHSAATPEAWTRTWTDSALEKALGGPVPSVSLVVIDGVWTLRAGGRDWRYDDAHRAIAAVLGWDALPSPADRVRRVALGWEVQGVGSGHRVGLCLGD